MRYGRSLVAIAILGASWRTSPRVDRTTARVRAFDDSGTIRIHLLGHAIGAERYRIVSTAADRTLIDSFAFVDRGGRIALETEMRLRDGAPISLRTRGRSYRFVNVDADVNVANGVATYRSLSDSGSVRIGGPYFTVASYAPLAAQALLVQYWERSRRPARIQSILAGANDPISVEYRGRSDVRVGGRDVHLSRYSVSGVAWGRETIWLEGERFAAAFTRANMLPLEGVREDLADAMPALREAAIDDARRDMARAYDAMKPAAVGNFAIVGARIVDGTGAPPVNDGAIIVRDGRIAATGPRAAVMALPAARGAKTIDARDMTVIPGLWDMHAHVATPEWGPAYLGVGVTTARDMGGEKEFLVAFRDAIDSAHALGPRMLLAGLIDGGGPESFGAVGATTTQEGRAVVDMYHAARFRQIKLYTVLEPAVVTAIIQRAHELGMTVTGHVPRAMSLDQYIEAGADMVAHMPIRGDTASAAFKAQAALLAAKQFVIDPTLSWGELLGHANDTPIARFQPGFAEAPWPIVAAYGSVRNGGDSASVSRGQRSQLGVVKALHAAGVPIVAGTDYGVPGFSLLRELELYAAAGMTPIDVIRSATAVPARVMGMANEVGTIEVGKRADLLILRRDPLVDISNVRTGRWVVANGRMYEMRPLRESVGFVRRDR